VVLYDQFVLKGRWVFNIFKIWIKCVLWILDLMLFVFQYNENNRKNWNKQLYDSNRRTYTNKLGLRSILIASSDEVASCPLDLLMKKLSPIYRRYCHIIHGRYPRRAHQWSLFCHVSACNKSRLLRFWESHVFVSDHGYNERHCRPISRTFLDTKKPYVYVSQQRSSWRRISQDWIQQVQSFIRIP
jgi:hypothetical protein